MTHPICGIRPRLSGSGMLGWISNWTSRRTDLDVRTIPPSLMGIWSRSFRSPAPNAPRLQLQYHTSRSRQSSRRSLPQKWSFGPLKNPPPKPNVGHFKVVLSPLVRDFSSVLILAQSFSPPLRGFGVFTTSYVKRWEHIRLGVRLTM